MGFEVRWRDVVWDESERWRVVVWDEVRVEGSGVRLGERWGVCGVG